MENCNVKMYEVQNLCHKHYTFKENEKLLYKCFVLHFQLNCCVNNFFVSTCYFLDLYINTYQFVFTYMRRLITLGFRSLKRLIENSLLQGLARCTGKFELQAKEKQLIFPMVQMVRKFYYQFRTLE